MSVENQMDNTTRPVKQSKSATRFFTGANIFVYRLSGGKIGGHMGKAPILLLTTTGRKSGLQRTTPLLYLKDGDNLILVASNGGAPTHPTWSLNLRTNPQVEVEIGKQKQAMTARQASAEERARLWPLLINMYPGYAQYQKKTTREIPVVILSPR